MPSAARRELGGTPRVGLDDGVRHTFAWYSITARSRLMSTADEIPSGDPRPDAGVSGRLAFPERPFLGGISQVPVSGKVFDADELENLVDASLDFWLTTGRFAEEFEKRFAKGDGHPPCRALQFRVVCQPARGQCVDVTAARGAPPPRRRRGHHGCGRAFRPPSIRFFRTASCRCSSTPSWVPTTCSRTRFERRRAEERAPSSWRTRLGNPFDLDTVMELAEEHDLWVVEDTCDAVGATYRGKRFDRSATSRLRASTPPTTSRWVRAAA